MIRSIGITNTLLINNKFFVRGNSGWFIDVDRLFLEFSIHNAGVGGSSPPIATNLQQVDQVGTTHALIT